MRTFPADFTAKKNLLTEAAPVWIFKFTAGGFDYYVSDNAFAVAPLGISTLAWVESWGNIQEGITGTLDEFRISDFSLNLLIATDASPNMETLAIDYHLEESPVCLYLWFHGCTDPPQEMFRGYIKEVEIPDETKVQVSIQDESLRLERAVVGTVLSLDDFPQADPDEVGKVLPLVFGTVQKLPTLAIVAGIMTSLPASINGSIASFSVSSASGLSAGSYLWCDQEKMLIQSISGDALNVSRGAGGTAAVAHDKASVVWEDKAEFVYLAAGHPVSAIPKVYGVVGAATVDITTICTRYTGQVGNAHPSFPGRAVVTIPGYVTAAQSVALVPDASQLSISLDGATVASLLSLYDPGHAHTTVGSASSEQTISSLPSISSVRVDNLYGQGTGTSHRIVSWPADGARVRTTYNITIVPEQNTTTWIKCYVAGTAYYANTFNWVNGSPASIQFTIEGNVVNDDVDIVGMWLSFHISAATRTITLANASSNSATGSSVNGRAAIGYANKAGTITLSGNSVANTLVADQVLCDVTALNSSVADVVGQVTAAVGIGDPVVVGDFPAYYSFSGAITELKSALHWLNELAFEARAWFKCSRGQVLFIYRPDVNQPVKILASCRISSGKRVHSRAKTNYDEILNTVTIRYNRDWTKNKDASGYLSVAAGVDMDSVSTYGARERADLFQFDFVTTQEMAEDVLEFYLSWYKDRHWLHTFDTFLYDADLEFADAVELGFSGNAVGQVLEAKLNPGNSTASDTIGMVVIV